MAVYGCITWGYDATLQPDGSYRVTRTLMGNTTNDNAADLQYAGAGQGPSQTFIDVVTRDTTDYFLEGGGP